MLHFSRAVLALSLLSSCSDVSVTEMGVGGAQPWLLLPFPSGTYWSLTQGYNTGSHVDYGFSDESYAMDFGRGGCKAYGEPVTPMAPGTILEVLRDGEGDHGFGNSILIDHSAGYTSRYAHLSEIMVNVGDSVGTNTYIGKVGNTGYVIGTACSEHPGTHLHTALYKDGVGIKPEPLSGMMDLTVGCWYNREGTEICSGEPGEYDPETHIDDEGELEVAFLDISPEIGTAQETEYVWMAIVVSPDFEPEAKLQIFNPNDSVTYDFEMETESLESPWVFTYRKTLRDAATYSYWVRAYNGDGHDTSDMQTVRVDNSSGKPMEFIEFTWTPSDGVEDETIFHWDGEIRSDIWPNTELVILNPNDAMLYRFPLMTAATGFSYISAYHKTLRDPTTYYFWMETENGYSSTSSEVGTAQVYEE